MKARLVSATGLLLLLAAPMCLAQSAMTCPTLPVGTALHWERSGSGSLLICKALDAQGAQAFGVMLTSKAPDKPSGAREEKGVIDSHQARWYHAQIANRPDAQTRLAVIELDNDRYAQIWIDAPNQAALETSMATVRNLQFDPNRPVADTHGVD